MAIRICPQCMTKVPASAVVAYTDGIECPGCKSRLEVSRASRLLSCWLGMIVGYVVWRLTRHSGGMLGWVLPMVYGFFAFSVVTPLYLMLTADLRLKPAQPTYETAPAAAAHSSGGAHD